MEKEAEDVQQEQYAHAIEVSEESLVVVEGQVMGDDVADDIGDAYYNQKFRVDEAGDDE